MRISVEIPNWAQACCGDAFAVGDTVTWTLVARDPDAVDDGPRTRGLPRFFQESHETSPDVPSNEVSGVVESIAVVVPDERHLIGTPAIQHRSDRIPGEHAVDRVAAQARGDDAGDYRVVLQVPDDTVLPGFVQPAWQLEHRANVAAAEARMRDRRADDVGRALHEAADAAERDFGAVATVLRDDARGAVSIEPHADGSDAVHWSRSTTVDDGIQLFVRSSSWALPATAGGVATVQAAVDAAASGRVTHRTIRLDSGAFQLTTEFPGPGGEPFRATTATSPPFRADGTGAGAGAGFVVAASHVPLERSLALGTRTSLPWRTGDQIR